MSTPNRKLFNSAIAVIAIVFLLTGAADAQVQRRRDLPVTAESKAVERTSVGNTADMIAWFEDAKVSLAGPELTITFYSRPGLVPIVEIGTSSPRQKDGRWVFQDEASAGQGNAFASQGTGPLSRKVCTVANTLYIFESKMFNIADLEPISHPQQ